MVRITLAGAELVGLERGAPAASVRLLLPGPDGLVLPEWNGNEFLDADGSRPLLRTLTPVAVRDDGVQAELDVDIVVHGRSPLSTWVRTAVIGDEVAVSGTGAGYDIDPLATGFVLFGDESAIPAMSSLLDALPADVPVVVHVEVTDESHRVTLSARPGVEVHWHLAVPDAPPGDALVSATTGSHFVEGTRTWAAGEAAAVQRIRKLLAGRDLPRGHAVVRGYWKVART